MKAKIHLIYLLLLSILLFVGGADFFDTPGETSKNLYKPSFKKDYALTDKIRLSPKTFPQSNSRPLVKIIAPKDKSSYPMGTRVVYQINVSDIEDGESEYGEIPSNEVLLKVEYPGSSGTTAERDNNIQGNPPGLLEILSSNCLNCHAFKDKLIGPSFYEISERYDITPQNMQTMAKHVKEGSSGVWGNTVMPSHPELSNQEIHEMVQWIMKNAGKSNIDYYTGTEGSIKIPLSVDSEKNVTFILTASYTDHGEDGGQRLKGQDSVIIYAN
ncbi:c-type cytochrome [Flavobacteriaceae bacterium F89]|uniref:C-type cytochrome n=1 Tax=Cerina litoralis TaxID=2874477 RepID=A0AAE3JQB0_9FLAO|nr:c-type cytochrome [Cerina litoralis]MCG2461669.1 c-type cytochrome [Cerina litoralis]